jgi:hypothetical protein
MLKTILQQMRTDGKSSHKTAADLVEIADKAGILPSSVVRFPELLKKKRLKPEAITEEVLSIAHSIERMDQTQTQLQIERINDLGRKFFARKYSPLVRRLHKILVAAGRPLSLKGATGLSRELAEVGIELSDLTEKVWLRVWEFHQGG